jgi:hypothetical protein
LPSERTRCLLCGRFFDLVGGTGRVHKNRNRLDLRLKKSSSDSPRPKAPALL